MSYDRDRDAGAPDEISRLIAEAGRRPAPPEQIQESVRAAVEQVWSTAVSQRNFRRRATWLSAAAAVGAIAVGLGWLALQQRSNSQPVAATLLAARGDVTVTAPRDHNVIVAGSRLRAGTTVHTAASGFVLMTVAAVGVRVGPDSALRIGRGGRLQLEQGRIYAETGGGTESPAPLTVATPFGQVSHLGTQFQVVVKAETMAVSVRSGRVRVRMTGGGVQTLQEGQGVEVVSGGAVREFAVTPYGASWAWADAMVPDFPIDGRSLGEFLAWYTHETGLRLVLAGPGTAAVIRRTKLSGSIAGMTPDQALAAVMATTHLEYDMSVSGELRIRMRGASDRGT